MTDNIDRDKVEKLIGQNNEVQEKFIILQFAAINDKLDTLLASVSEMTSRQTAQEFAILSLEKEKE
jgi:hypothetical protein